MDDYSKNVDNHGFIVVCVNKKNYADIEAQLTGKGLREGIDFIGHTEFFSKIFPMLLMYRYQQILLPLAQISLTERCTLKCKKCAHACNLVSPNTEDLSIEQVQNSAKFLFSFVEYVQNFVLIGGEPFLYKDLEKAINYIGTNYRERINHLSITTNGTITPSEEILLLCKKYDVFISISNYSKTLPRLKSQHVKLIAALKRHGIKYGLGNQDADWMDYGFDYLDRRGTSEQLIDIFDACQTPCHEVRGEKFYFCVMARSVAENMKKNVGQEDYLDLSILNPETDKKIFFEYIMGYSEKGYLDMCNYCHGAETIKYPIPVAEQM